MYALSLKTAKGLKSDVKLKESMVSLANIEYETTIFKLLLIPLKVFYCLWFGIKSLTCKPTLVKIVLNIINYVVE